MTYADYITDSLRLIGVIMQTESADADQGAHAIGILNDMMAEWAADGIRVGYVPSETTSDDLSLHTSVRSAVKANLAMRLCPNYERNPSAVLVAMAQGGYDSLLLQASIDAAEEASLRNVPRGTGNLGYGFNINTGLIE